MQQTDALRLALQTRPRRSRRYTRYTRHTHYTHYTRCTHYTRYRRYTRYIRYRLAHGDRDVSRLSDQWISDALPDDLVLRGGLGSRDSGLQPTLSSEILSHGYVAKQAASLEVIFSPPRPRPVVVKPPQSRDDAPRYLHTSAAQSAHASLCMQPGDPSGTGLHASLCMRSPRLTSHPPPPRCSKYGRRISSRPPLTPTSVARLRIPEAERPRPPTRSPPR